MVEEVGGLLGDPLVGLLGGGARDLVGLLAHLVADPLRVGEQLDRVGALGPLARDAPASVRAELGQRLVGRPGSGRSEVSRSR